MAFDGTEQLTPLKDLLNSVGAEANARVQSGSFTVNIVSMGTSNTVTVTFPVAFPSTPRVTCSIRGITNAIDTRFIQVVSASSTDATFSGKNNDSTANITFDWIAVLP